MTEENRRFTETWFQDQRLAEKERLARLLERFRAMEAAGRRSDALKCFQLACAIPGFHGSAEAEEMEDSLARWAKKTALTSVRSLGIIPAVPDFSVFSEERVTTCAGGRLIAMSVESTGRYGNRVRVFTREGKTLHGLEPPSGSDRCFIRGDRVLALPSGFSFDLEGRTLRNAGAEPWKPTYLYDVDPAGKRALFGTRNVNYTAYLHERKLETGENRRLIRWPISADPVYLADGSVLTEGPGHAERLVRLDTENGCILRNYELNHGWTFEDAGDGYYRLYSELGDGKTYLLDIDYGKTENGTNIGIWGDTQSDAQLFKFVDTGNGTYNICTKVTNDNSGIGVTAASKEIGANVIEWACNESDDQKWILEIKIDPIEGDIFKNVIVNDIDNYQDWQIAPSANQDSKIYGDRDFVYTSLPDVIKGAESILTACDSKNYKGNLVTFNAGCDMTAYVLLDKRVEEQNLVPEWLGTWTKTDMTASSSNDVTYSIYTNTFKNGETVVLGDNGTNYNVINYAVFGTKLDETIQTETTTETPSENPLYGDANCDKRVSISDAVAILQYVANSSKFPLSEQGMDNADVYKRGDGVSGQDASAIQKYDAGTLTSLPESYQ